MTDAHEKRNRILIAFFLFSLASLTACTNKLSHQDNTDSTAIIRKDPAMPVTAGIDQPMLYDTSKRYIYITLDDGPQHGTMNCYHVLKNEAVKASFFMIGVQAKDLKQRLKADSIRNAYPEFLLCNHSFTHAFYNHYKAFYNRPDSAMHDIMEAQDSLRVPLKIFRTPANNSWAINGRYRTPNLTKAVCHDMDSIGYKTIGWDVEWRFKNGATPVQSVDEMVRQVNESFEHNENFTKNHVVILAHDRMFERPQYADSLSRFVALLKEDKRYVFETINHYPGVATK